VVGPRRQRDADRLRFRATALRVDRARRAEDPHRIRSSYARLRIARSHARDRRARGLTRRRGGRLESPERPGPA
jgi:hypothetical protein